METAVPVVAQQTGQLRVWVDGRVYADPQHAKIAATDSGLIVGNGVFESLKVTPAGAFAVRRHLERLTRSARALGMPLPDHAQVREAIEGVLEDRTYTEGMVRVTYTAGRGPLGSQAAFGPTTLVVAADQHQPSPPTTRVVTAPWTRNEHGAMAGVKSTSYAENVRALAYATERHATEAIFLNTAGNVCEGTGSNLFCIFGTQVITAPLASGPLAGITRALVLEWSDVSEVDLTLAEAQSADEVFVTSSLRDVQAVSQWDDAEFAAPGAVTEAIASTFAERSANTIDP